MRAALDVLVSRFPHKMYKLSQESNKPWFTLEWVLRMEDSKGNPVNRPAEILEGGWDDSEPTLRRSEWDGLTQCPHCKVLNDVHRPGCPKYVPAPGEYVVPENERV